MESSSPCGLAPKQLKPQPEWVAWCGGEGGEEEEDNIIKAVAMDTTENMTVGKSILEAHFEG